MIDKYGKIIQPANASDATAIRVILYKGQPKLVEFRKKLDTSKNQKPKLEYKENLIELFNLDGQKVLSLKEKITRSDNFIKKNVFDIIYCYSNFFIVQESTIRDGKAYSLAARKETLITWVFDYTGKLINKHNHKWYDTNAIVEYFERQVRKTEQNKLLGDE